ncbi:MAG: hypothetical protein KGL68_13650 [Burkholderiales bacterium]|nr:hypothetical protein [Burkholderiales bacterium]
MAVTRIGVAKGAVAEVRDLPGAILSITVDAANKRALVAMGNKGLAVIDLSTPTAPALVKVVSVGYSRPSFDYVDGGGNLLTSAAATETNGTIAHVLVYNDGTDDWLVIANEAFGVQKTKLANLNTAADGAQLVIDGPEAWTLKYAGENPWGGPRHLKMHGGLLYVVLGFIGLAIYDPATLSRTGLYNLYGDASTSEDWFGYQNEKAVEIPGTYVDADGMPTWQQAQLELQAHRSGTALSPSPWAAFDRYGKYYYNAQKVDVIDLPGPKTMAYIAYGLGGLVAVDVTNPATPHYSGYVPAAPAHGPDEPTGQQNQSILSHHGSGMLKDGGVTDVRVIADSAPGTGFKAYMSEHFAGLVVVAGAENPQANWHNGSGHFNKDNNPSTKYWPDYEFVTSYDMTPVPVGEESMPKYLVADGSGNFTYPILLATGEINGHGGALLVMASADVTTAGQVDVVQASGAGGLSFIDIKDLTGSGVAVADRFAVPVHFASTSEVGAAPAGMPTDVAIGHTEGLAVMGNHLFVADGPHGMSVWRIADTNGAPIDVPHLVANTLMDEYPTAGYIPAAHAAGVYFGDNPNRAFVMCQSIGMRAVDVSSIGSGAPGAPVLLNIAPGDVYEHSTESSGNLGGIKGQDHAYGATFYGNYAIVADGGNGLTVYDTSVPADPVTGVHVVANLGGTTSGKPPLGRASAVKLWTDPSDGRMYAISSAGPYGISVVDMTDLLVNGIRPGMTLIKTFEPIKLEEEEGTVEVGSADGKAVDVQIAGDVAYFSYDSYGLVAYRLHDLVQPVASQLPGGVCIGVDPTKVFNRQTGLDCRPVAAARYKLQADPAHPELATVEGGAQYMTIQYFPANRPLRDAAGNVYQLSAPRTLLYVGYSDAGVIKLDWSDITKPTLLERQDTIGTADATAIANGRVYVADGTGGVSIFK